MVEFSLNEKSRIIFTDDLYLANVRTIYELIIKESKSYMITIIGHNPGLSDILSFFTGKYDIPDLKTSSVAQIIFNDTKNMQIQNINDMTEQAIWEYNKGSKINDDDIKIAFDKKNNSLIQIEEIFKKFDFIIKSPPASHFIKEAVKLKSGSKEPGRNIVAKISKKQLKEIAEKKMADLNAHDVDEAAKIIAGSARSMGIEVK